MKFSCRVHGLQDALILSHGTTACKICYNEQLVGKEVFKDGKSFGKVSEVQQNGLIIIPIEEKENLSQINS